MIIRDVPAVEGHRFRGRRFVLSMPRKLVRGYTPQRQRLQSLFSGSPPVASCLFCTLPSSDLLCRGAPIFFFVCTGLGSVYLAPRNLFYFYVCF